MKVYSGMDPRQSFPDVIAHAQRVESLGYDGLQVSETVHDSLALSLLVAEHTSRITIRTSVALAFVRSPTLMAYAAWDLAKFSGGRFELGLGTQIRQNIEGRYGMPWSDPVGQMSDYLDALDALFRSFSTGEPIDVHTEHYTITRMQPYFNPGPDDTVTPPALWLGGVNRKICVLAGARAEGFVTHPTNSNPRYLETLCIPALSEGFQQAHRSPGTFELVTGTQVITGATTSELDEERERQRRLFAFLYSTPAYRPTLDIYGWGELAGQLQTMIRANEWDRLHSVVTDDVLDTLIPTATYEELPNLLRERFSHLCQGITVPVPGNPQDDGSFRTVIEEIQEIPTTPFGGSAEGRS
jgi:probable F420-dependent oxidoreductase